ncbi:MAG: hypothetical protein SFV23_22160 [Planctomycetaceae bacterium]|nr:hypothetical protein [Planctomycetaceae bacterium]
MRDEIAAYAKRVRDLHEHVRGNEQATKQSIIGPLLTLLGYDLTDPRECVPEYRADFGPGRSNKPVDWAFFVSGKPAFFVEAKDAGRKLGGFDEQLADYFAKTPDVKLGILTNGIQRRFYTDAVNPNIMDKEPYAAWDVLGDDQPPFDVLRLLQKAEYNAELIRAYAQRKHRTNQLVSEINRLLEPSSEFVKLAVSSFETRNLTSAVVETWKPIVEGAIEEWARQRTLSIALRPAAEDAVAEDPVSRVETTQDELDAFALVREVLGSERPVESEDTTAYFKVHLPGQPFWAVCRFFFSRKRKQISVPIPLDRAETLCEGMTPRAGGQTGWSVFTIEEFAEIKRLAPALHAAWDGQKSLRGKSE